MKPPFLRLALFCLGLYGVRLLVVNLTGLIFSFALDLTESKVKRPYGISFGKQKSIMY